MNIVVNTIALGPVDDLCRNALLRLLVDQHPEHHFVFLVRKGEKRPEEWPSTMRVLPAGPASTSLLAFQLWHAARLPLLLKKLKADCLLSCNGVTSSRFAKPQHILISALYFLHLESGWKKNHAGYYKKNIARFIKAANTVSCFSAVTAAQLKSLMGADASQPHILPTPVSSVFKPIDFATREQVKEQYTKGAEYFIYTGGIHPAGNLVQLLKAFSIFKKRQQTGMKLVITGSPVNGYADFTNRLKSYRYREEVVMTGHLSLQELAALTGAAYAMVHPSAIEGSGVKMLEAARCAVPAIVAAGSALAACSHGAALLADVTDTQDIAAQMMLLYKDEILRGELIEKAKTMIPDSDEERAAAAWWSVITGNPEP